MTKNTIEIPRRVFQEIVEAGRRFSAAEDALEDFLLASDKSFIKKMRRLRLLHRRGRLGNWERLKARYGL